MSEVGSSPKKTLKETFVNNHWYPQRTQENARGFNASNAASTTRGLRDLSKKALKSVLILTTSVRSEIVVEDFIEMKYIRLMSPK